MTEKEEKKAGRDRKELERAEQRAAIKQAIMRELSNKPNIVPVIASTATIVTKENVTFTVQEGKHGYELMREGYEKYPFYLIPNELLNFLYANGCSYIHHDGRSTPFLIGAETAENFLMMSSAHAVWHPGSRGIWRYLGGKFNNQSGLPEDEYIAVPANLNRKYIARDMIKAIIQKYRISNSGLARRLGIDHTIS